jgi:hypothetical protein
MEFKNELATHIGVLQCQLELIFGDFVVTPGAGLTKIKFAISVYDLL